MQCSASGHGASGSGASAVSSTLLWGLLAWCLSLLSPSGELPPIESAPRPALDALQGQCELGFGDGFRWRCGMELNIFTELKRDDFFAIAAIFRKANEISNELRCLPEEYPIKGVYGGGGYHAETWLVSLREFLYDLQRYHIVADESRFDVHEQTHRGPTALDQENPAYDMLPGGNPAPLDQRTRTPPQTTLDSATSTVRSTMERLGLQSAPIIMALRPLHEFTLLWSQFSLNQTEPRFKARESYRESVRREPWLAEPENVKAALLSFSRFRIATYQGPDHFAKMGRFFAEQIRDLGGPGNVGDDVRRLEETFVTWPKQFLVVNRDAILSSERPQKRPMFDRLVQPDAFRALERWPEINFVVRQHLRAWNRPLAGDYHEKIQQIIDSSPGPDRHELQQEFVQLGFMRDVDHFYQPHAQFQTFMTRATELGERLSEMVERQTRGTMYPWVRNVPKRFIRLWGRLAWLSDSVVPADNLLLPFCLERQGNLVLESFRRVNYAGRDALTDRYRWPDAGEAPVGSVWFTNASALESDSAMVESWLSRADYFERRMEMELGALYTDAWTPLPVLGRRWTS
ncbi:MAG: hypothetical protein M1832_005596 [Thelocarpon impressellum]|nr:MAG: hypothetical protein M1832_005596 [Thelocarpon impressellum]